MPLMTWATHVLQWELIDGSEIARWSKPEKHSLSSDRRLQLAYVKSESLVIAGQHTADDFRGVTGGVYKARERIHRAMADARLLANPASWGRVADPSPNWDRLSRFDAICITPSLCTGHCNTCVAPDVRAVLI